MSARYSAILTIAGRTPPASMNRITAGQDPSPFGVTRTDGYEPSEVGTATSARLVTLQVWRKRARLTQSGKRPRVLCPRRQGGQIGRPRAAFPFDPPADIMAGCKT